MNARVLLFSLGGESYAVDLDPIESILPEASLSRIPRQPPLFEGFLAHQGECIPVVSLHRLLGAAQMPEHLGGKMLVVRHRGFLLAFCVDAVLGTRRRDDLKMHDHDENASSIPVEVDGHSIVFLFLGPLLAGHARAEAIA